MLGDDFWGTSEDDDSPWEEPPSTIRGEMIGRPSRQANSKIDLKSVWGRGKCCSNPECSDTDCGLVSGDHFIGNSWEEVEGECFKNNSGEIWGPPSDWIDFPKLEEHWKDVAPRKRFGRIPKIDGQNGRIGKQQTTRET